MRPALALVLLLLAPALAGCIGSDEEPAEPATADDLAARDLPEKLFDVLPTEIVWIESPIDGKAMHTAVYRPDTDEPVGVFINFSPYWGDTAEIRGDNFAQYMIEEYVPRGFAVVLAAIRGTGHSEGCFQIAGDKELADLNDVIDHFANVEWSNGNVVAGGKSYDSTPQNGMIAKDPHPALKGLFHVSGITDMYRYNYRMGVPYSHGTAFNTYYYLQGTDEYGASFLSTPSVENAMSEDPESLSRLVDDVACPELPEIQANGIGSGVHGMYTDYWIERDWNRYIGETDWNGSIFFVHGLQDWNVKPDHILPWLGELPEHIPVKGWLHQNTENNGHVYPMRADWNQTMLAWLDHTLNEGPTIEWNVEVESSDGLWRESETWPPADVNETRIPLRELVGRQEGGHMEMDAVVLRSNDTPVRYAGAPTAQIAVEVEGNQDPVFTAVLYDQGPDGELEWINEAVMRGLYRNGLEAPEPVPQAELLLVELPFYPQDDVLEPGHNWVLVFGDQPRYAQVTEADLAGVYIDHDDLEIHLPFAPVERALEEQPVPIGCFAC